MCRLPVLAGLFILLMVSLPTCAHSAEAERSSFPLDARIALHAYGALVETRLAGILAGARTLASTEEARSADWARIKEPLSVYAQSAPSAAAIWFARPDGTYYTLEKGLTNQNVKDREYFSNLMDGQDVEGVLVVSRSTGEKSIVVGAPILVQGRVLGALGASVGVEKLAETIDSALRLPPHVVFYALEPQGRTALHRDSALMFEFPSEQGSETLASAVDTMLSKPEGIVHYSFRGSARTAIFERSKPTGWIFVLGRSAAKSIR